MNWDPTGTKLATICKDGYIRIYEPLSSDLPIVEGKCGSVMGSKGASIEWVLNGSCVFISGFGKYVILIN